MARDVKSMFTIEKSPLVAELKIKMAKIAGILDFDFQLRTIDIAGHFVRPEFPPLPENLANFAYSALCLTRKSDRLNISAPNQWT